MRFALATVLAAALSLVSATPSTLRRDTDCSSASEPCSSTPAVIGGTTVTGEKIQECCADLQCVDETQIPAHVFGEPVIAAVGVRISSSLCVEMRD